jgi:hypothetical protein
MRRYRLSAFVAIVAGLLPLSLSAQILRYNVGDPLQFGVGYNTLTGEFAGNCMQKAAKGDIGPPGEAEGISPGQLTRWELSSVQDLSTLSSKLDFSASASASFAAGSVSAAVQYMKSKSFNKYHEFVYVSASVANSTSIWTPPKNSLLPDDLKLRQRPLEFLRKCGDAFVRTITTGGELTAVLDINTLAQEDASNLSISVSGNYGTASGQTALTDQLRQTMSNRSTHVTVFRAGGTGAVPNYTSDDLIKASMDFPVLVAKNPVPLQAQLASYDVVAPPVRLTAAQQQFIAPLFRLYKRAMQSSGNLQYIQGHTSEFRVISGGDTTIQVLTNRQQSEEASYDFSDSLTNDDKQRITTASDAMDDYVHTLEALATGCLDDPQRNCKGTIPPFPNEAPVANVVRIFSIDQPWATNAGPVDITLPIAYMCKVESISGNWQPGDGRTLSCAGLPKQMTHGHILTGEFDNPKQYGDNVGTCTYHFICARK